MKSRPLWSNSSSFEIAIYRFRLLNLIKKGFLKHVMQAWFMAMKERNFTSSKGVWGFQEPRININYSLISFPLVVFVETMTYNLVNLKDQNSFNISHNVNPTFSLINNQSNLFEDRRGFIIDTPKDIKLDFFVLTFGICCVFFQLKPLLLLF
jgi:hypothetical protein